MKKCGIICEYNPLHNGHVKHIALAKKQSNCDAIICIMSGNFVQRAEGAVFNKFERAKHAILAGADIVIELPTIFAVNSAQDFAYGAVKILDSLKCDCLHFGSESGNIESLLKFSDFLLSPSDEFQKLLKDNLGSGMSYPASISAAVQPFFESNLLASPNNSLAVEYIKAIRELNSEMIPMTVLRSDNYNSTDISNPFCSATAIRNSLKTGNRSKIKKNVPDYVYDSLVNSPIFDENEFHNFEHRYFSTVSAYTLKNILGVEEGLENRLAKFSGEPDFNDMLRKVKSKRYTMLKLKRIILNCILGIDKDLMVQAKEIKPYWKVLAIEESRLDILSDFAQKKDASSIKELDEKQQSVYNIDIKATNLYYAHINRHGNADYTEPLLKIKRN